jgi:hypothetical protein
MLSERAVEVSTEIFILSSQSKFTAAVGTCATEQIVRNELLVTKSNTTSRIRTCMENLPSPD